MITPENYEDIQKHYTSDSRSRGGDQPSRMGRRVVQNVKEFAPYFADVLREDAVPILSVGAGDGLEIEQFLTFFNISKEENLISQRIIGIEVSEERCKLAQSLDIPVYHGTAENMLSITKDVKYNIYMAHCLEHCFNRDVVIANLKAICYDTLVIIVPIELRGKTANRAHYNPISNLGSIANLFGMDYQITTGYRFNLELEGWMVIKKHRMNWPEKYSRNSSELLIK